MGIDFDLRDSGHPPGRRCARVITAVVGKLGNGAFNSPPVNRSPGWCRLSQPRGPGPGGAPVQTSAGSDHA